MRAIPDYYSWPESERERYQLTLPKEQDLLVRQALPGIYLKSPDLDTSCRHG